MSISNRTMSVLQFWLKETFLGWKFSLTRVNGFWRLPFQERLLSILQIACQFGKTSIPLHHSILLLISHRTNKVFKSTIHRVTNLSGKERYSIPFFFGVDYDATVSVLENHTSKDNPPCQAPFKAGEVSVTFSHFFEHVLTLGNSVCPRKDCKSVHWSRRLAIYREIPRIWR